MNRHLFDFNDKFALLADNQQWLVCRKGKKGRYDPIAFIGSNKLIIERVLREKDIDITQEAREKLDDLPFKFREFLEERDGAK